MVRFIVVFVILQGLGICLASELSTVSPNSIQANLKPGYTTNITKDGLTKRGIKVDDLSAKSYDPPPEYYRGPASSSSPSSSYNSDRGSNTVAAYATRPVAFPEQSYGYKGGNGGSYSNNGAGAGAGQEGRKGLHDRISAGHYTSGSNHNGYGSSSHGYGSSTTAHPYGPPQAIEYEYYAPTGNSHGYSEGGEGIPVELYNRGYGGYGHPGEYYTVTTGHGAGHGGGGHESDKHGYDKALLAKSFLIPLASAAVLGIAAALASNPLLLQLGTVSSIGKRRRRALEEKLVHSMAYRGQQRN